MAEQKQKINSKLNNRGWTRSQGDEDPSEIPSSIGSLLLWQWRQRRHVTTLPDIK